MRFIPLFVVLFAVFHGDGLASEAPDFSKEVKRLGIPLEKKYPGGDLIYARNIWDLQAFDGKLFIGSGNSNNEGPAPNAAPVEVWGFDPKKGRFFSEGELPDCQLSVFRIIEGNLTSPGHDPTESWELGNFYIRENRFWKKYRTVPGAIHVYDLLYSQETLFAAIGANREVEGSRTIMASSDGGATWRSASKSFGRVYGLFELNGVPYGSDRRNILQYDGEFFQWIGRTRDVFSDGGREGRVHRAVNFKGALVYVLGANSSDHQWFPLRGYVARSISGKKKRLPLSGLPFDVVASSEFCFVMTCERVDSRGGWETPKGPFLVRVYGSADLETWTPVLRFRTEAFARSFELLDHDFYFGLGCHVRELHPDSGAVLRLNSKTVEPSLQRLRVSEMAVVADLIGGNDEKSGQISSLLEEGVLQLEAGDSGKARRSFKSVSSKAISLVGVRGEESPGLTLSRSVVVPLRDVCEGAVVASSSRKGPFKATVEILDRQGKRVLILPTDVTQDQVRFRWNGTDEDGDPVPSGEYFLLARASMGGRAMFPVRAIVWVEASHPGDDEK